MTEIGIEDLSLRHLNGEFCSIEAFDDATRVRVWETKRLLPFVGQNHPGTEVTTLYVRVSVLDAAAIEQIESKIGQLTTTN